MGLEIPECQNERAMSTRIHSRASLPLKLLHHAGFAILKIYYISKVFSFSKQQHVRMSFITFDVFVKVKHLCFVAF